VRNTRSSDAAHTWDTGTATLRFGRAPGAWPFLGPVPPSVRLIATVNGGLGTAPIGIDRTGHFVLYVPLPTPTATPGKARFSLSEQISIGKRREPRRQSVRHRAGSRIPRPDSPLPYPRQRALLTALDGTTTIADSAGTDWLTLPPAGNFASPTFLNWAPMSISWPGSCRTRPGRCHLGDSDSLLVSLRRLSRRPIDYRGPGSLPRTRSLHRRHPSSHSPRRDCRGTPFHARSSYTRSSCYCA
jgi:hypothetical protein